MPRPRGPPHPHEGVARRSAGALAPLAAAAAGAAGAASCALWASAASAVPPGACELIVVRHGETEWNRALRVQGSTDVELNARGRAQAAACAEAIADRFRRGPPSSLPQAVWSSRLGRAAATAAAVAAALAAGGPACGAAGAAAGAGAPGVREDARLNEWDLGVLEGLRKEDAARLHADDWALFSENWSAARVGADLASRGIAGGESMLDVRRRAVAGLEDACREARADGRTAAVAVTHGGVLGQLLQHAVAQGGAAEVDVAKAPANACISRFWILASGQWQVRSWARTDHLTGDLAPASANYDAAPERA